ncbi:neural proliferation differentiation and control protein 1 [Cloeon dipterum]|uniref:neural proliferation differentiation and control protein 1 n=1 Tax=Cloeon dipterum TaxID=197152 RepID=UPI0032204D04
MQGTNLLIARRRHHGVGGSAGRRAVCALGSMVSAAAVVLLFALQLASARQLYSGDITPEELMIDQVAAILQQRHLREREREAAARVAEYGYSPEMIGPGGEFSYQFPPLPGGRESQHEPYFAVNPSDPRYYLPKPPEPEDDEDGNSYLAEPIWNGAKYYPLDNNDLSDRPLRNFEAGGVMQRGGGRPIPPANPEPPLFVEQPQTNAPRKIKHQRKSTPSPTPPSTTTHEPLPDHHARVLQEPVPEETDSEVYFLAIIAGCSAAGIVAVIATGICWYKLQRNAKATADVEYPAYGVTGPNKDVSPTSGDRRLAQSAQMYHYQHQKQQIIAMESRAANERRGSMSEAESDDENDEGDYTVYECPGLASTCEMEVKNPLFLDDPTPATPVTPAKSEDKSSNATDSSKRSSAASVK